MEQLIDEIRLELNIAGEQECHEHFRESRLLVKHTDHRLLLNPYNDRVRHGGSRGYMQRLTGKASFAKKIARARHRDDPLLAVLGYHGKLHVALFDVEDCIGGVSLQENACVWAVLCSGPSGSHRC